MLAPEGDGCCARQNHREHNHMARSLETTLGSLRINNPVIAGPGDPLMTAS